MLSPVSISRREAGYNGGIKAYIQVCEACADFYQDNIKPCKCCQRAFKAVLNAGLEYRRSEAAESER